MLQYINLFSLITALIKAFMHKELRGHCSEETCPFKALFWNVLQPRSAGLDGPCAEVSVAQWLGK